MRYSDLAPNTGEVTAEGMSNMARAIPSGTMGLPGDIEALIRALMKSEGQTMPTTEDFGEMLGADTEDPAFDVGTFMSPDPMSKLTAVLAAAPMAFGKWSKFAEKYPDIAPPVTATDGKKTWLAKGSTPENKKFMSDRNKIAKEVQGGDYEPYFNPEERFDADPGNYPLRSETINTAKPKKPETVEKWRAKVKTPEAAQRLQEAYDAGVAAGGHDAWYKMGQLEAEFIKEFGPKKGPEMFRERFSDAIAATTGGADPTGNLLTAAYGNYLRTKGLPVPTNAYDMPNPVGGRFISGNMSMYNKVINQGEGLSEKQAKRHNFSTNFEGQDDVSTIDEHMTQLITPGKNAPEGDSYFAYEELIKEVAKKNGVSPREMQEVAWGGRKANLKGGYEGKSMIEIVNEAVERTSRLTGVEPSEVVRKGLVRGEMPIYEAAGAGIGAGLLGAIMGMNDNQDVEL